MKKKFHDQGEQQLAKVFIAVKLRINRGLSVIAVPLWGLQVPT